FGLFDSPISQAEFREATVFNGDQPVGKVAEFEELIGVSATRAETNPTDFAYYAGLPSEDEVEALKGTLVYYYMYNLDLNHRKIQSLQATSRLLKENGIKPIFYITPINYQLGEKYLGPTFRERLAENTAVVERVLRRKGVDVLNLVFDLEAYNFMDTEHLTENGKTYIAKVLAATIEPPQPDQLTSTTVDDPPTPSAFEPGVSATALPTTTSPPEPGSTPQPTPTATRVVPVTVTPRSLAGQQARLAIIPSKSITCVTKRQAETSESLRLKRVYTCRRSLSQPTSPF
ncbi:MAG: hypothetical protein DPW09_44785, partial [Anaerolineae bacterium]|nr:hypothetical protein [Anaerolineae bacterium]